MAIKKGYKELVVLSGKGGTGKTTITAALAQLADNIVLADCDVDASDLHIITNPTHSITSPFVSGKEAKVVSKLCTGCQICAAECRFDAFETLKDHTVRIRPIRCEGCGLCVHLCPEGAITFEDRTCGEWKISETRFGPMGHARLDPAEENSGLLVSLVRQEAKKIAQNEDRTLMLSDGPPGIGCPVISSVTGVDGVLVVTEPSLSSLHDMKRVTALARQFEIEVYVCINRSDVHPEISDLIKKEIEKEGNHWVGDITFNSDVVQAQLEGKNVIEYGVTQTIKEITHIWENVWKLMNKEK